MIETRLHITAADKARDPYFYVPFTVPEGTTRIDVAVAYVKADDCVIDLGLLDPSIGPFPSPTGFRGWSGGAREGYFVATDDATPGYLHGAIEPGQWQVILGLYRVPSPGVDVEVTITLNSSERTVLPPTERTRPVRGGAGWYRGDLHCHTFHSDAAGSPETLHAAARQAGLDFLAIADHNTTTQRRYFHPASTPDLVFVRGMEITTAEGHANAFGVDAMLDFRMTKPSDAHILANMVHAQGGLLSINHDKPTIPWTYEVPEADCMEVWQSSWFEGNWISLARWQQRLQDGMHLSAIGGSDYHQPAQLQPEGPFVLARPTTVLWLDELSEDAILAAMKAGRGYITESPTGPHLEISVGDVAMGARAPAYGNATAIVRGAAGDMLVWIDSTGPIGETAITGDDFAAEQSLCFAQGFIRAEIVALASRDRLIAEVEPRAGEAVKLGLDRQQVLEHAIRRAISNPIYLG